MSSERNRKAAYRKVAELIAYACDPHQPVLVLGYEQLDPLVLVEVLRIRDALRTAGNVPELANTQPAPGVPS